MRTQSHHAMRRLLQLTAAVSVVGASTFFAHGLRSAEARPDQVLGHVGTFYVDDNLMGGPGVTSAEIVDITADGGTMVYTDAFQNALGFVDIEDPENPGAEGLLGLPGSPTSVAIHKRWALAAIATNTDPDGAGPLNEYDNPSGKLLVIDLQTRATVRTIDLAGQPDSIAISPNGRYAAITIENERDEDENDGFIPQLPAGSLNIIDLVGQPASWGIRNVSLSGLPGMFAPTDPEPEFVDINSKNQAVVSLQENNHLAVVNLVNGSIVTSFSAGAVDISNVDTVEEALGPQGQGVISPTDSLTDRRREPDAVQWIDDKRFATANEGDYEDGNGDEGGTRSFTIFNINGTVEYEAGNSFEHAIMRAGHYPEARSENKGNEPEGLEVARWRGKTYLFVASERANIVGVYDVSRNTPELQQLLPTGIGPEGLKFLNGTLVVTSEVDGEDEGFLARPLITIFGSRANAKDWSYPQIESVNEGGLPIPWVALSSLAGDPWDSNTLWTVSDSYLAQAYVYKVDVSGEPAVIKQRIPIGVPDTADQTAGEFDFEGVAVRKEGGFWFASEGRTGGTGRPNLLVRTDAAGNILTTVGLPQALVATMNSSGFEGVAVTGTTAAGNETVWVVIQRPWTGDPANHVKVGKYVVATNSWTFAHYPLDAAEAPAFGTVGLSEITALGDGTFAIIERDNQLAQEAAIKRIYRIDPSSVTFQPFGSTLPVLAKTLIADVLDELDDASISVPDKLEGLAVARDGDVYVVTDNDGNDENYGETLFFQLGQLDRLLSGDGGR